MAKGIYRRTKYLKSSTSAFIEALNSFNDISNKYRIESSLILMANAIELVSKAVLLKKGEEINEKNNNDRTISAEKSVWIIYDKYKIISDIENEAVQQIISLRNEASHNYLPEMNMEMLHYLLFSGYKFYKKLIDEHFSSEKDLFKNSFLSISPDSNLTYADSVEGLLRKSKKSESQRRLLYLLERGVKYNGTRYVSQDVFERDFRRKKGKRLVNRSNLGKFISKTDLLKVVFIQAPKNHTINIDVAKGKASQKEALPVIEKRTDINKDYPYILTTLSEKLGIRRNKVLDVIHDEKMKGNDKYHQEVKTGRKSVTHKYSDAAFQFLNNYFSG